MSIDANDVKQAAAGKWPEILTTLGGIPPESLNGKNGPCPRCGGTDRFRFIDPEAGACYCNQCFREQNGDGLAALCFAKGWTFPEAVKQTAEYLGLSNGNGRAKAAPKTRPGSTNSQPRIVKSYDYRDEAGELVFQSVRMEPKDFRQRKPKPGGGWDWSVKGCPVVPYRLPEILAEPERGVIVCEGEKDCDSLAAVGLLATCNAGGAGKWTQEHAQFLRGRRVVILPDNDPAGQEHAQGVAASLQGVASSVRIAELPGLDEKGDVSDWLAAGGTKAELVELIKATPEWQPSLRNSANPEGKGGFVDIQPWRDFPTAALPEPLQSFVRVGATAIGCDDSFLALPTLAACAGAIGATYRVSLKRAWSEPSVLWTATVGESGSLKSPPFRLALRPIKQIQRDELNRMPGRMVQYQADVERFNVDMTRWKKSGGHGDPPLKPDEPRPWRSVVSDATIESLAPILLDNPRGILCARDELAAWIGSFDKYNAGKRQGDGANWLSLYDAEPIIVDRKGGVPKTIYVPSAAVSVCGTIQPGILQTIFGDEERDSGLFARLLLAMPPNKPALWREDDIPEHVEASYESLVRGLLDLAPGWDAEGNPRPRMIPLARDAKALFVKWHDEHARELADRTGDEAASYSKLKGACSRLALVFHCIRAVSGGLASSSASEIDLATMESAIELTQWFKHESLRVLALFNESDEERQIRLLLDWLQRRDGGTTPREAAQGMRAFDTPAEAEKAMGKLVKAGIGAWEEIPPGHKGGRPSRRFNLLPTSTKPQNSEENRGFVDGANRPTDVASTKPSESRGKQGFVDSDGINTEREVFEI